MPPSQAPTISVDDADNIRRFIQQMSVRSGPAKHATSQPEDGLAVQPNTNENSNGTDRDLYENSTNSSSPAAPEHLAVQAYDMQSPQARGVLAPPPTPKTPLGNEEIGKMIHDQVNAIPTSSTFSLGESRYAPKKSSLLSRARPPGVHVSSSPNSPEMSPEQRKARDMSFSRMSFMTSDEPPSRSPKLPAAQANLGSKELHGASLSYPSSLSAFVDESKPRNDSKESKMKTAETENLVSRSRSIMDYFVLTSNSSDSKNKSPPKSTTVTSQEDSKAPVSLEDDTKGPMHSISMTPPHLRAPNKQSISIPASPASPSSPGTKIKDEPTDESATILDEFTPPGTPRAELIQDPPPIPRMAAASAVDATKLRPNYSPSRGTLAVHAAKNEETLKNALFFTSWPKSQGREQPGRRFPVGVRDGANSAFKSRVHGK